ncbi:DNA primase [Streptococcus phage Javan630]|uniref:Virulence-associated E family protein n=1 Tax=Vagococcus carniphilus TaxID=218144 RepID=A0AAW8U106_9ENTE|nr:MULTISPECIES: virulence-associated E family protein [Lactobacillales]KKF49405.1 virulence-associated protein E [Streptococcus uberis C8329]MDT2832754.1 virulence-associated E family protein [Vagococcus carniphilus]QBX31348.1 DNA primase [Streptococcus phage Javan630]
MKIAYGNSRMDKRWKNTDISWEDFCSRVKTTQRTTETVEEYRKMKKGGQDSIKDVGGFVGGHLKDGRRKKGNVLSRSMLTLDMDYGTSTIWEEISTFFPYQCCIYSTHKHTPEHPRLRLIIPLFHDVGEEEYAAVSRMVAKEIGIDLFDDTTYEPERLMYWPSTSRNGIFVYEEKDGSLLDPDVFLNKYDDWRDTSTWPVSSRQSEILDRSLKEQADPLSKEGVIGTFCRTYSVSTAIDTFLKNIYAPSVMAGRYDYIPADSSAGVILYDDKFAYSHHATDPASGRLLNAFDLVRIHKFGHLDDRATESTSPSKLPSFINMCEFAIQDDEVKAQFTKERMEQATIDFTEDNWQTALELDKQGKIKDTLDNIVLIIRNDSELESIAFNKHRDGIDARDGLPWEQMKGGWNDSDNAALKVYLSNKYGIYSPTKTKDAILAVAAERSYHPIKEYLDHLPEWDGIDRVETLLIDYFNATDNSYTRAVTRKMMVAAVARIVHPGTKFDSVLILNGPQGIGKSTFFAKLAGDWFSDSLTLTDMKDKAGPEKLQGYWILELGELAGMRKTDVEVVKSFISRSDDKYRASYGVNVESHPRQCIIVGSTNAESGFLRDITGNRRFWPVRISGDGKRKAWQMSVYDVEQIWAETLVLYGQGEKLYLEGSDVELATNEQADAMESDEREGLVRTYLDTLLPDDWNDLSLYERRNYLNGSEFGGESRVGTVERTLVCNMEIWCECFGRDASAMKPVDSYAIAGIMKKINGWNKYQGNKNGTSNFPIYGRQRCYEKNE